MRRHRFPSWLERLFPQRLWEGPSADKSIYLTFDDGPVSGITDWVLEELGKRGQVATFFMVGDNVRKHPELAREVLARGHRVGNHTYHHLHGWRSSYRDYLQDVADCDEALSSVLGVQTTLFRPPYGELGPRQARALAKHKKIVMWSLLSYDVDPYIAPAQLLTEIKVNTAAGKILVFHDQQKTKVKLQQVLPDYLDFLMEEGYNTRLL
jgi:peptidoglycan/xylan/chitin deacetylase (PgdA/CDA1 family)